jgi:hypothetical protein
MTTPRDDDWLSELGELIPADPPDPWAAGDGPGPGLSDEQRAFLTGLADTPPVQRLRDLEAEEDPESTQE